MADNNSSNIVAIIAIVIIIFFAGFLLFYFFGERQGNVSITPPVSKTNVNIENPEVTVPTGVETDSNSKSGNGTNSGATESNPGQ